MRLYELIRESGSVTGRKLTFPELIDNIKFFLDNSETKWNMREQEDNMVQFSSANDFDSYSQLIVEYINDEVFEYGHGIVYGNSEVEMFERNILPMNISSADKIATDANVYYFDVDFDDEADAYFNIEEGKYVRRVKKPSKFKSRLGAGIMSLAAIGGLSHFSGSNRDPNRGTTRHTKAPASTPADNKPSAPSTPYSKYSYEYGLLDNSTQELVKKIIQKHKKVDPDLAAKVVSLAKKYEKPVFPKAEDLLAIIGIESAFNPGAISDLETDPAHGLTQVRPIMWGQDPKTFIKDIEQQIKVSSNILDDYNRELKNPAHTVQAYNMGINAFKKGRGNIGYLRRFEKERQLYD